MCKQGFLAPYQQAAYLGWVDAVMLVDYKTSGVGPYQELLFIPGLVKLGSSIGLSISKIYVSTYDSVWNDRRNWGIPKELASFTFANESTNSKRIIVHSNGRPFLSLQAKPWGSTIPITTGSIPGFKVIQSSLGENLTNGHTFSLTRQSAIGTDRFAYIHNLSVGPLFFPDISMIRPILAIYIDNFRLTFPLPEEY